MRSALVQFGAAVRIVVVMTIALGVAYPLAITAFAQVAAEDRADGQIIEVDGAPVGSRLIAQEFTGDEYFLPRPSPAGYDASASTGSNLGPTNPELLDGVATLVEEYREVNGLPDGVRVPVDAVTGSGSGLDPHISPANAHLQAPRVADARGLPVEEVLALVDEHTDRRPLAIMGDDAVNVLELNVALDGLGSP